MAGVKGRSGGSRPNTGGARSGAGRKPNSYYIENGLPLPAKPGKKPGQPARKVKRKARKPVSVKVAIPAKPATDPKDSSTAPAPNVRMERQAHGGALCRPVAPATTDLTHLEYTDMLALLTDIALGKITVSPNQLKAAIAAIPYTNKRADPAEEKGKKEQREEKAKEAAASPRFAPMLAPTHLTKMQ